MSVRILTANNSAQTGRVDQNDAWTGGEVGGGIREIFALT